MTAQNFSPTRTQEKEKKKFSCSLPWCKKNEINNQVFLFQKYICGHDKDGSIHSLVYLFHNPQVCQLRNAC